VSRVTINVRAVRGVRVPPAADTTRRKHGGGGGDDNDDGDDEGGGGGALGGGTAGAAVDLTCRLTLGRQSATTPPAPHLPKLQASWMGAQPPITFTATEPRGGCITAGPPIHPSTLNPQP
jgi:hypothetical protein